MVNRKQKKTCPSLPALALQTADFSLCAEEEKGSVHIVRSGHRDIAFIFIA